MKVGIVHDWLTGMRGGERCLEVFCAMFPDAELFTLFHRKGSVSSIIERHPIRTSFLQQLPFGVNAYRYYLPLFPLAVQTFDLTDYDLVLSSSHCVAKGIRIGSKTFHVSYIHTPMRYLWDQFDAYFPRSGKKRITRLGMMAVRRHLQRWDVSTSQQIHLVLANSYHVAQRIKTYYGRSAQVVYPPVDWSAFDLSVKDDGYYLMVTALAPYKRIDLAIEAANRLQLPLKIVGAGQEDRRLRRISGPTVEFLGWRPDEQIKRYYQNCRAVLFPGEEDFGIVPLEAMACGKPVIAYGKGGALETVVPINPLQSCESHLTGGPHVQGKTSPTGVFFYEPHVESLIEAINLFERRRHEFDGLAIRNYVKSFDRPRFQRQLTAAIAAHFTPFRYCVKC